jgi:two-component system, OmpR family, sensor histidine kinase VicK
MECLANLVLEEKKPSWQIIVSNVKTFVEGQQYVFDTLWSKALPAEQKIEEIEGNATVKYETKVLNTTEEALACLRSVIESANERFVVGSIGALQIIYDNFFDLYKRIVDRQRRGQGRGVRWITSIYDASNIELVKIFLNAGVQMRHIRNLPPMNFAVDDRYFYATIEDMEKGRIMQSPSN